MTERNRAEDPAEQEPATGADGAPDPDGAPSLKVDGDGQPSEAHGEFVTDAAHAAGDHDVAVLDAAAEVEPSESRALVPAGDVLRRSGILTEEQTALVAAHQAETGLDFDNAAISLALATPADIAMAEARLRRTVGPRLQPVGSVSDEIIVLSDPTSPRAEAIRLLRTQVISQHIDTGRRGFAVTGATEGSGASYIAANLAVALAQVGIKTLLVDANLRTPRIDAIFGIEPAGPGLATFLGLQASRPERIIYADVLPNLSIIPAGPPVARPQELLSGARFRAGVDILLREFDVAIFDSAPANENADALSVAGVLGYALVVARRNNSYVRDLQVLTEQLGAARASIIGSVLNMYQ
ncbi:MAG: CpsD/CapB family tyrosine-protein kinase [Thermaurantiacus sp.]